jgi:restriction endonuclease S subunit
VYPDWQKTNIGKVLTIGSGKDYKHLKSGKIPVYGTGGFMTGVESFLYDGETVCIGRKGTIDKPQYLSGKIWTVDTLFYTHSFVNSHPKFIYYLFQSINWLEYNEASGVPSLSKSTIQNISIEIPCIQEQSDIAKLLSRIDNKIQIEMNICIKLNKQKEFLLSAILI